MVSKGLTCSAHILTDILGPLSHKQWDVRKVPASPAFRGLSFKVVGWGVGEACWVQEASRTLLTVPFRDSMNPNTTDLKKNYLKKKKSLKITTL